VSENIPNGVARQFFVLVQWNNVPLEKHLHIFKMGGETQKCFVLVQWSNVPLHHQRENCTSVALA